MGNNGNGDNGRKYNIPVWEEGTQVGIARGDPRNPRRIDLKEVVYFGNYYEMCPITGRAIKNGGLYLLVRDVDGEEDWLNLSKQKIRRSILSLDEKQVEELASRS